MVGLTEAEATEYPAIGRVRILVAIEPRSYREVIASTMQILRPRVEVIIVEPEELGSEMMRLDPELVICSLPETARLDYGRPAWVEFRPYERPAARISIEGRYSELDVVELADLLSIVDDQTAAAECHGYQSRAS